MSDKGKQPQKKRRKTTDNPAPSKVNLWLLLFFLPGSLFKDLVLELVPAVTGEGGCSVPLRTWEWCLAKLTQCRHLSIHTIKPATTFSFRWSFHRLKHSFATAFNTLLLELHSTVATACLVPEDLATGIDDKLKGEVWANDIEFSSLISAVSAIRTCWNLWGLIVIFASFL